MTTIRTRSLDSVTREINPDEEVLDLRRQVDDLKKRLLDYKTDTGGLKTFFRDLAEYVKPLAPEKPIYRKPKVGKKSVRVDTPVTAVAHWTDWHMGKVQAADEVEGFGEFSPDILKNRITQFCNVFQTWIDVNRNGYTIDALRILVTGDMISGGIHDELNITNAYPVPLQVVEAANLLARAVAFFVPHYREVAVDFVSEDNHGRLTKKPQASEAGINSFNYLVGYLAQEKLSRLDTRFVIHPVFQRTVEVAGRMYLLTHGHNIRGWAGFPYYGIERKVGKEAIKRMTTGLHKFDRIIMGHWHAPLCHPHYWIGGSPSGTDAYDHKAGRHSTPSQAAWLVHPRHGEFARTDFDLGNVRG